MDDRIREHLQHLNRYYLLLREASALSKDAFLRDEIRQASVERFLHLAIESCLNIGNRMISLYQFETPIKPPETYADIFHSLRDMGVVDAVFAGRLVQMAKFRNRLVHLYWEIDKESLFGFLQTNLNDFIEFRDCIVEFLNRKPPEFS
jgi:uncharacterized protein YutE (UPF0331/DUF86 family)